jgi:DNA-binding NarL/FixJ family response regulator
MSREPARALIVEDDRSWQQIVAEILTDLGLAVDVADTLEAAVEALASAPHRLAVVDLSLSGPDHRNRDGFSVLEAIRRQDPGCAAVLLTGFATVELAVSALTEYGALTCLRKESFRRAEFREVVQRALALAPTPPSPSGIPQAAQEAQAPGRAAEGAKQTATQILVVEDDAGWRSILSELLSDAGYRPRACPSYGEALGLLRREKFELAVVDLSLASSTTPADAPAGAPAGNRDGFEVLRGTKSAGVPTVVVSGLATPSDVERLYAEFGIFACLEKQQFERAVFTATVQEALAADRAGAGELARLTRRERDVMALLVRGLTNKGIAREMVISENTVKRYLKSIFEKLDVDNRAAAVAAVLGSGSRMS